MSEETAVGQYVKNCVQVLRDMQDEIGAEHIGL